MEIYFLTWDYYPLKAGGAERYVRNMSRALQKRGHTVRIITRRHYSTQTEEKLYDVMIYRMNCLSWITDRLFEYFPPSPPGEPDRHLWLKYIPLRGIFTYIQILLFMKRTKKFLLDRKTQNTVVIVPKLDWLAGLSAIYLQPDGIILIGCGATNCAFQPIMTRAIPYKQEVEHERKKMSAYIALTDEMKNYMIDNGVHKEKIHIIPNGVYIPSQTANVEINTDVLCVANFTQGKYKAFDTLFRAWKIVASQTSVSRLVAIGRGDATPYLKSAECDCARERIVLVGHSDTVENFYMSAAVFVLPSRTEGMSIALLEAQSFGIPAVVSDIAGNRAVVVDGYNGFVVPVDNFTMLAEKIIELLRNPDLRRTMGQNAYSVVKQKFDISMLAAKTEELCYNVVGWFPVK